MLSESGTKKSVGQGRSRNTFNPPAPDIKKHPMVPDDANRFQNAETKVVDSSDRTEVIDNRVRTSDRVSSGKRISTEIQPGLTLTQIVRLQVGVKRFKQKSLKRREIGQRVEVMIDSLNKDISTLKEASRPIKLHLSDQYSKSVIDVVSNTRRVSGASDDFSKTLLRLHQTSGLRAAGIDPTDTAGSFGKTYIIKRSVGGETKTFAVKEMHSARNKGRGEPYSDAELQRRFVQELASPLAIGKHKNIIDTYGGFEKDGRWYLVMEAAEGDMLGRFGNPATSRAYFQQLVAGVDYMHNNRNIAHLDIKAQNAVLMPDGKTVKLIDFGSASGSQVSATRYRDVELVASVGQGHDYANLTEVRVLAWLRYKGLLHFRNIGSPNPGRLWINPINIHNVNIIRAWLSDAYLEGVIKFNPKGRKDEIVIREFIELYDPKSRDIFALGEVLRVDIGNRSPLLRLSTGGIMSGVRKYFFPPTRSPVLS